MYKISGKTEARKPVKRMVLAFFYVVASNQIDPQSGAKIGIFWKLQIWKAGWVIHFFQTMRRNITLYVWHHCFGRNLALRLYSSIHNMLLWQKY